MGLLPAGWAEVAVQRKWRWQAGCTCGVQCLVAAPTLRHIAFISLDPADCALGTCTDGATAGQVSMAQAEHLMMRRHIDRKIVCFVPRMFCSVCMQAYQ